MCEPFQAALGGSQRVKTKKKKPIFIRKSETEMGEVTSKSSAVLRSEHSRYSDELIRKKKRIHWIFRLLTIAITEVLKPSFQVAIRAFRALQADQDPAEVAPLGPVVEHGDVVFAAGCFEKRGEGTGGPGNQKRKMRSFCTSGARPPSI